MKSNTVSKYFEQSLSITVGQSKKNHRHGIELFGIEHLQIISVWLKTNKAPKRFSALTTAMATVTMTDVKHTVASTLLTSFNKWNRVKPTKTKKSVRRD